MGSLFFMAVYMRKNPSEYVEVYRKKHPIMGDSVRGDDYGYFEIPYKANTLFVIACSGIDSGWDHVSVSLKNRCPNWPEMVYVKDLFWEPEECTFQFHPPEKDYINTHPYCLHIWKPTTGIIPLPPKGYI